MHGSSASNQDHSMLAANSATLDSYHEEIGGPTKNRDSGHAIKVVLHAPWFRIS
jgi:hypothetical protein